MASNEVVPGPIARNVIANVRRLRARAGLTLAGLSERLTESGRPILPTGLQRLEAGKRRVDPDDLVGLAAALEVSPVSLLLPHVDEGEIQVTDTVSASAAEVWNWMRAKEPLGGRTDDPKVFVEHQRRALPVGQRVYDFKFEAGKRAYVEDHPDEMIEFLPEGQTNGQRPETP